MSWETVIGLEIHAQLSTQSKIFSGSPTAYGASPNSQANLVDLAYPGVLPVLNTEAVRMAVKFGLAVDAAVAPRSVFARKNYFYPDLPKGYQISQYELPVVGKGHLDIVLDDGTKKRIGITRAHLEEDAGKSLHEGLPKQSGIDLNRAGTPLIEIVSEPDMRSAKEAVAYLKKVHTLVRYLEICDGNMQEGSFRCDANVSVRKVGAEKFGTRAEIKNINSFRFVEKAINYEVARQIDVIESGGKVVQETRLYDPDKGETRSMRSKEEANDYRYFPDPDLLPVEIDAAYIATVKATLPELPDQKAARFASQFGLSEYDAGVLTSSKELAAYYEEVAKLLAGGKEPSKEQAKLSANWVAGSLAAALNEHNLEIGESRIGAARLAGLLVRIADNTISGKIAKDVFEAMWSENKDADSIIESKGLKQITDTGAIERAIEEVMAKNPGQLADYRSGKDKLFGFFVGQVMKATAGKANPAQLNELLKKNSLDNVEQSDRVRRFVLERHPIRGHAARLESAWLALREHQDYPPVVQQLLGEAVSAVVLLAATLKFNGTLTLQLQGKGLVNLLVAQCTHDFRVRGVARHDPIGGEAGFRSLTGEGQIVVTVEASDRASSYQGVVPITGNSLAESLEAYFHQSEQLPTRVLLAATPKVIAGMLVQRLPGEGGKQAQLDPAALEAAWMKADHAMDGLTRAELLEDDVEQRLVRMFGVDEVRVFTGHEVRFECRCSRERVANVLRSLGQDEVRSVIAEQGACTVTCEFCQKPYKFDAIDVEQLFTEAAPKGSDAIN